MILALLSSRPGRIAGVWTANAESPAGAAITAAIRRTTLACWRIAPTDLRGWLALDRRACGFEHHQPLVPRGRSVCGGVSRQRKQPRSTDLEEGFFSTTCRLRSLCVLAALSHGHDPRHGEPAFRAAMGRHRNHDTGSAPLVYFHRHPRSLEPRGSICSFVRWDWRWPCWQFLSRHGRRRKRSQFHSLMLSELVARASCSPRGCGRRSFVPVGYGTKMGLARCTPGCPTPTVKRPPWCRPCFPARC